MANKLFSAQTSNGNGTAIDLTDIGAARSGELVVYGTFDSSTFKLQSSPDGGTTWIDVVDMTGTTISITSAKILPISFVYGEKLRGVLSGGGGSMSITAFIRV